MICPLCFHHCDLKEGQHGLCHARVNKNGHIIDENYGRITSLALDPIEKKPLKMFYPGSKILSVGSYGCNLRCPFCQNYEISQADQSFPWEYLSPADLIDLAIKYQSEGNIGVAFTYNEPTVSYEYVKEASSLAKKKGLKTVLVTNGTIEEGPLKELLPFIDALNIDLKGFTDRFYQMCGGDLDTVKKAIQISASQAHVEVTTLIIPGENDSEEEMRGIASFLASIDKKIPLHITRFFPMYKMSDKKPTPIKDIFRLTEIAKEYLAYVFPGNI
ncbi:MAG: AmmeMemoRadiSam system radical SAM enzyme [Bacilli bacterium]|jgi:pyruvate formate lyase activating enzyme|nr:AmmeMemoRadiSam system radical SAM enzyme [Bacilli bacterium]